jgi:DNA-binding transcriptional ArsR family regulator
VSQHLRVLSDAGLVAVRPAGNRRLYRCRRDGLRDVAAFIDEMWSDGLARLKLATEREEWPQRARAGAKRGHRP